MTSLEYKLLGQATSLHPHGALPRGSENYHQHHRAKKGARAICPPHPTRTADVHQTQAASHQFHRQRSFTGFPMSYVLIPHLRNKCTLHLHNSPVVLGTLQRPQGAAGQRARPSTGINGAGRHALTVTRCSCTTDRCMERLEGPGRLPWRGGAGQTIATHRPTRLRLAVCQTYRARRPVPAR